MKMYFMLQQMVLFVTVMDIVLMTDPMELVLDSPAATASVQSRRYITQTQAHGSKNGHMVAFHQMKAVLCR